nr:zinc finger, CCHC-type [Tanacetum cinerariifolium]
MRAIETPLSSLMRPMWCLCNLTPYGSISTWDDLTTRFLAHFFPPGRTSKLQNDILMFQQHQGESLSEAWTRFKNLLQKVPHHGIDIWLQVQIFYDHINQTLKRAIDYAAGGRLGETCTEKAWSIIEELAQYVEEASTRSGLHRGETIKAVLVLTRYWPSIGDEKFVMGGMAVKKVRHPRVRLAHRCITTTILGRKEFTQRISVIDLFYLYCIYGKGVTYKIPYWLARYLNGVRDKDLICGGMFVSRISRSFGLLTNVMVDALSVKPRAHIFKKKSLISMRVVMDLGRGTCYWPAT